MLRRRYYHLKRPRYLSLENVNEILGGGSGGVDIDDLARRVIRGEFGNGQERRNRLGANYDAVQARVNQMLS